MDNVNKATHTPGPWVSLGNPGENRVIYSGTKAEVAAGSTGCDRVAVVRGSDVVDSVAEANARLIAAAPELLAAIEHVFEAAEDCGDMNDIDWNMLRDALAKATA